MRRFFVPFLIGVFLWSSARVWGKQGSVAPAVADSEHQAIQSDTRAYSQDCSGLFEALRAARQKVERDRQVLRSTPGYGAANATDHQDSNHQDVSAGNLQQDLLVLDQKESEFNQCAASNNQSDAMPKPPEGCSGEPLLEFQVRHRGEPENEIPIWHLPGSSAFFYEAGMTIDADGAPNAYHPDNTGLDDLRNAGAPGNWEGLAKDRDGEPYVQGPDDPFPGYYVSATALADRSKPANDPTRYVDASKIPFIVLPGPMAREVGARPGDFAVVFNQNNGKSSYAIFGDIGPSDRIGEGSIALAENLGIRSDARNGGARRGIIYLVFPGSGNRQPRSIEEIDSETEKLVQHWGGTSQLTSCTAQQFSTPVERNRGAN
jgi:Fungal chitosanase of glycosyl hydrolase group 75